MTIHRNYIALVGLAFLIFSLEVCAGVIPGSRISPSLKTEAFPKIAVVQIEQVLGEFRGKLKDQFSKYLDKYYKEFSVHEEKLREEHRGLLEQQKAIKKEDKKAQEKWAEKMREFEARIIDIQKIGEEKRHRLEQQYNQIVEKIYQEIRIILKELADEKDIKLFIKDQHALHWDPALDMTDIVYKRLKGRIAEQDLKIKEYSHGE